MCMQSSVWYGGLWTGQIQDCAACVSIQDKVKSVAKPQCVANEVYMCSFKWALSKHLLISAVDNCPSGLQVVSSPAHFRPPFCNGPKGGLAHLLDILIPPLGRLPKSWQAPPCLAIRNLAASFAHLRESYLVHLSNEIKLYPILPLSQF